MTPTAPTRRCAAESLQRDEPVTGTATHVRTWLLLEHTGPWGHAALRDARLPDGLGDRLTRLAGEQRAKILLVRRYRGKPEAGAGVRVFAAYADPERPRLEAGVLSDPREVLDLDLGALRRGGSTGLEASSGAVFATCTNGRHDACCAERGRPVAKAVDQAHPEEAWEVSHIGGDRFAANMVLLPHGLYYGRVDETSALTATGAYLSGELDLDHLRGRSSFPVAVQAAEIELRRRLGVTRIDDLVVTGWKRDEDVTTTRMAVAGAAYDVAVRTSKDAANTAMLTCKAVKPNPLPVHDVLSVVRAP